MILTVNDYIDITGEPAGEDFALCAAQAEEMVHAHTLYAYEGADAEALPPVILDRLKRAIAWQTQALLQQGGVGTANESQAGSMSLGKFSYSGAPSGDQAELSPAARVYLPVLIGYGRGMGM